MSDAINPKHYNQGSIECIDAMEQVLTAEEYRGFLKGNLIKYLWREKNKSGIEDLLEAKRYLDRLVDSFNTDHDSSTPEVTGEVTGEVTREVAVEVTGEVKPPDGWRWLEVGEVIRKGDLPCKNGLIYATEPIMIGMALQEHWKPMIRRNRFEVGEKVVVTTKPETADIFRVKKHTNDELVLVFCDGIPFQFFADQLAPYIEDAK